MVDQHMDIHSGSLRHPIQNYNTPNPLIAAMVNAIMGEGFNIPEPLPPPTISASYCNRSPPLSSFPLTTYHP